jgi:NADH-quinone oxidoreductase subunit C
MNEIRHTLLTTLQSVFGTDIIEVTEPDGLLSLTVEKMRIREVIAFLKNDANPVFGFLTDLCGVHYPDQAEQELGVVYHLHSLTSNIRLRLRVFTPASQPSVLSVTNLFPAANWMERETFDFYGIHFVGHPNLRRILNMDEMTYHPLLKQYPLEDPQREDKEDKYFGR